MIRASFTLVLTLLLMAAGGLWLLGEIHPQDAVRRARPRLRSVDLDALREQALEAVAALGNAGRAGLAAVAQAEPGRPPSAVEPAEPARAAQIEDAALPRPEPFVDAPLGDPAGESPPAPGVEIPEPPDAPLVVATRDQDAWAELIRRMLALHRRAGGS